MHQAGHAWCASARPGPLLRQTGRALCAAAVRRPLVLIGLSALVLGLSVAWQRSRGLRHMHVLSAGVAALRWGWAMYRAAAKPPRG